MQFGFRQKLYNFHALINLKEKVAQAVDEEYVECGILVDFKNAFSTVDHEKLLSKFDYYGIGGISNN